MYCKNTGPRSWQYRPTAARSIQGLIFSKYGPKQGWLIRGLLHNWKCLENPMVTNWKDIINFKGIISIESQHNVYTARSYFFKSKRRKRNLEEKENQFFICRLVILEKQVTKLSRVALDDHLRQCQQSAQQSDWLILVTDPLY